MNNSDITITLSESQHELLNDIILHALESYQLVSPYDDGMWDLPINNSILQRYTMIQNLREMFNEMWADRFDDVPGEEPSTSA